MTLDGQVALITGAGVESGRRRPGEWFARAVAVALVGRTAELLRILEKELREAGGKALAITADVSRATEMDGAVSRSVEAFGRLDILVANAAIQLHGRATCRSTTSPRQSGTRRTR